MLHNLFSTPVYKVKLNLDNKVLNDYGQLLLNQNYHRDESNKGGFQSDDILKLQDRPLEVLSLEKDILLHSKKYKNLLQIKEDTTTLDQVWYNINYFKDMNSTHFHMKSNFSGVYYSQTPKDCGCICFHHPSPIFEHTWNDKSWNTINKLERKEWTETNSITYRFVPEAGDLYIFPSWSQHSVDMNKSQKERISVAFDII